MMQHENETKFVMSHFFMIVEFFCVIGKIILQIKYSFEPYQKSPERLKEIRLHFNDPFWRPPPLQVVNVS